MTEKNKLRGKKSRAAGQRFELKVRKDLEEKGWIVDRWSNNVDFDNKFIGLELVEDKDGTDITQMKINGKLIAAKSFMGRSRTNGFPDFIAYTFKQIKVDLDEPFSKIREEDEKFIVEFGLNEEIVNGEIATVIGVECKSNGYLDKEERAKCKWLLDNNIFSSILVAKKGEKRGEIVYTDVRGCLNEM